MFHVFYSYLTVIVRTNRVNIANRVPLYRTNAPTTKDIRISILVYNILASRVKKAEAMIVIVAVAHTELGVDNCKFALPSIKDRNVTTLAFT